MLETSQIKEKFKAAARVCAVGTQWRHKKGGLYMVLGHGLDTETEEIRVHYFRVGGPGFDEKKERGIIFDRPLSMWTPDRFQYERIG